MKHTHILLLCLIAFVKSAYGLESFTLDEFVNSIFTNKGFDGIWVTGNKFLTKKDKNYEIHEIGKGGTLFVKGDDLKNYPNVNKIYPSGDLVYGLIEYNVEPVYRHSKTAQYALYNKNTKVFTDILAKARLQTCKWAGDKSLIYVLNNNLFYIEDVTKLTTVIKISSNGEVGRIYNGVPDWVYEEEVFGTDTAFWLSQNKTTLIYAQFDDTNVDSISYVDYGEPTSLIQYPKILNIKYPKVGTRNPTVKLFHYNLKSKTGPTEISYLPANQLPENFILKGVTWNVTDFFVFYTNRIQNEGRLMKCNQKNCVLSERYSETKGWLDVSLPVFSKDGSTMAQIQPSNGFQQLWMNATKGKLEAVQMNNMTVVNIYGINGQVVYFSGTNKTEHSQQHVYSYDRSKKKTECLTCEFKAPEGVCKYASASFSTDFSNYAKMCHGPYPNYITLEKSSSSANPEIWEMNVDTRTKVKKKDMPQVEDLMLNINKNEIAVRLLLPPNFDKNRKYPTIVNVYGGPDSKQIKDTFSVGLEKYVVTSMNCIYVYIDGRGSGLRGNDIKHSIYKQLGTVEIEDQINATKKLQETYKYIDKERTCIWGWSYGGFATAWALVKDTSNVFKCGVAVAPVTNFFLYDSIYTERYLDSKAANGKGYDATDLTKEAKKLKGKNFFLIHGNADDNVHYQQSMLLARALELADVHFQQMSYPQEDHSLNGVSLHLYHEITKFWDENLIITSGGGLIKLSMTVAVLCCVVLRVLNV